jgi:fructosamine-3-kinase
VEDDRSGAFGWARDNFIGSSPQHNGWVDEWPRFFAERRLRPQLEALARRGDRLRHAESIPTRAEALLESHRPDPCLVHGDLWSGNAALASDGRGVLIDPAVHRADREVDLAMARLFGGFPSAFYDGYQREWPLPAGHHRRVDLYNLYHLLNHANLFGGGYLAQAQAVIDDLL